MARYLAESCCALASLGVAWQAQGSKSEWWLGAAAIVFAERIMTFAYFIPTALKLMRAESLPESTVDTMAAQWLHLNYIRAVFTLG